MSDAMASRFVTFGLVVVVLSACAPKAANGVKVAVPAGAERAPEPSATPALPPLTAEEKDLAERLRATVTHLAVDIGERNVGRSWNLASATDDLARSWEKLGYDVHRQGIVVGDDVVQNLDVRAGGGAHGGEAIVVCAHFDSVEGSPGADDNASGAAAVLELGRIFHDKKTNRSLRFALLANGESPYFGTDRMGSLVYATGLAAEGVRVVGAINVDGIGAYRSERVTTSSEPALPKTSDFIAVLGNDSSRAFFTEVSVAMTADATLPVASALVPASSPLVSDSDQWAFWKLGMPAIVISDTGPLRYAPHHSKTDLPSELDFDRAARVVAALSHTLETLAAE